MSHDWSGTNHDIIADGDTGINRGITADPDIVTDGDRFGKSELFIADTGINWVAGSK